MKLVERAHAKVNLVLRIGAREADGYHSVETVLQRLALADEVTLEVTDGVCDLSVEWDGPAPEPLGAPDRNLAWRAAAAYRDATGWPAGWSILLRKRIPAGAGLGGGSSDAAAVLRGLNSTSPSPLGTSALATLGARLGADVPFFVVDASRALGRGRGDRLEVLPALPHATVALARPVFGIGTAEAYRGLDEWRTRHAPPVREALDAEELRDWSAVARVAANDFEPPTFAGYQLLGELKEGFVRGGASIALLSGSGSTVFGLREGAWRPPRPGAGVGWFAVTETC